MRSEDQSRIPSRHGQIKAHINAGYITAQDLCRANSKITFYLHHRAGSYIPPIQHHFPASNEWRVREVLHPANGGEPVVQVLVKDRIYRLSKDLKFKRIEMDDLETVMLGDSLRYKWNSVSKKITDLETGQTYDLPLVEGEAFTKFFGEARNPFSSSQDHLVHLAIVQDTAKQNHLIVTTEGAQGLTFKRISVPKEFRFSEYSTRGGWFSSDSKSVFLFADKSLAWFHFNNRVAEDLAGLYQKESYRSNLFERNGSAVILEELDRQSAVLYYFLDPHTQQFKRPGQNFKSLKGIKSPTVNPMGLGWFHVKVTESESKRIFNPGAEKDYFYDALTDQLIPMSKTQDQSTYWTYPKVNFSEKKGVFFNSRLQNEIRYFDLKTKKEHSVKIEGMGESWKKLIQVEPCPGGHLLVIKEHEYADKNRVLFLSDSGAELSEINLPFYAKNFKAAYGGQVGLATPDIAGTGKTALSAFNLGSKIPFERKANGAYIWRNEPKPDLNQLVFLDSWSEKAIKEMDLNQVDPQAAIESMTYLKHGGCESHPQYIQKAFLAVLNYSHELYAKVAAIFGGCLKAFAPDHNISSTPKIERYIENRLKQISRHTQSTLSVWNDLIPLKPFLKLLPLEKRTSLRDSLTRSLVSGLNIQTYEVLGLVDEPFLLSWVENSASDLMGLPQRKLDFEVIAVSKKTNKDDSVSVLAFSSKALSNDSKAGLSTEVVPEQILIEEFGFYVAQAKITVDKNGEFIKTIQWSHGPNAKKTRVKVTREGATLRPLESSPRYAEFWADNKLAGLIDTGGDADVLAEYKAYYKENGFKFNASSERVRMQPWVEQKVRTGELDYWIKDSHSSVESESVFAEFTEFALVDKAVKQSAKGKEVVYLYTADQRSTRELIKNSQMSEWLKARGLSDNKATPKQLLFFNTKCNGLYGSCKVGLAVDDPQLTLVASKEGVETFFNSDDSSIKLMLDYLRTGRPYSEMREALAKKGGAKETYIFPDQVEHQRAFAPSSDVVRVTVRIEPVVE